MANEILVLDRNSVIFFILYAKPPLEIDGRAQVVTQASGALPELAAFVVGPAGLELIDAGRVAWEAFTINRGPSESTPHLRWRVNVKYEKWRDAIQTTVDQRAAEIAAARFIAFRPGLEEPS